MFGLLKIDFSQIKNKKNLAEYNSHYCSLCYSLSKNFGQFSRIAVNHEATLMSLIFYALPDNPTSFHTLCPLNFSKKSIYIKKTDTILADISIFLMHEKMIDDECDHNIKLPNFIRAIIEKKYHKACRQLRDRQFDVSYLQKLMENQRRMEKSNMSDFSTISEPTALLMRYLFTFLCQSTETNKDNESTYSQIGYQIGKWIYLMDSLMDLSEDQRFNTFNPILLKCGKNIHKQIRLHDIPKSIRLEITNHLKEILSQLKISVSKLSQNKNFELVRHLLTVDINQKSQIVINAMNSSDKTNQRNFDLLQASIAGGMVAFPSLAFASNGSGQSCNSCVGSLLALGIVFYAFKRMLRCNSGHMSCLPCMSQPRTIEVDDSCGGRRRMQRGFDGRYRDSNTCC